MIAEKQIFVDGKWCYCKFFEEQHEYWLCYTEGAYCDIKLRKLLSVTQLMRKYSVSPEYKGIDDKTLELKAQRGTLIHKELQDWAEQGEIGFTKELGQFIDWAKENGYKPLASEKIVFNDVVAGTIDTIGMLGDKKIIADYKTTASYHVDAVSYQLSIYEYLLGEKCELKCFWFSNKLKIKDVDRIPETAIEYLMNKERKSV